MRAVCVDDDEMAKLAREQELEVMQAELATSPRVYYKNLWRFSKCFIGGSVSMEANGVIDCVEGAAIRLLKGGAVVAQAATDNYGDFKFDRLDENSGDYVVEISSLGRAKKTVAAKLGASINLGEIRL
jgi:precorrin-6B methylase 2